MKLNEYIEAASKQ